MVYTQRSRKMLVQLPVLHSKWIELEWVNFIMNVVWCGIDSILVYWTLIADMWLNTLVESSLRLIKQTETTGASRHSVTDYCYVQSTQRSRKVLVQSAVPHSMPFLPRSLAAFVSTSDEKTSSMCQYKAPAYSPCSVTSCSTFAVTSVWLKDIQTQVSDWQDIT